MLKEHEAARWLSEEQLDEVEWLPADVTHIEKIRKTMKRYLEYSAMEYKCNVHELYDPRPEYSEEIEW